jgi:hypoxanthine-DNA glycosylase
MAASVVTLRRGARRQGLAPVVDANARLLILGSFPGEASLAAAQYYAHPRNQFWRLVGDVLDEPLHELAYDRRLARLRQRGIALWDTLVACRREGSLDAAIRDPVRGEIATITSAAPHLVAVAFNGATAGKAAAAWAAAGLATIVLPSSSPAHTLAFESKRDAWRALRRWVPAATTGARRVRDRADGRVRA